MTESTEAPERVFTPADVQEGDTVLLAAPDGSWEQSYLMGPGDSVGSFWVIKSITRPTLVEPTARDFKSAEGLAREGETITDRLAEVIRNGYEALDDGTRGTGNPAHHLLHSGMSELGQLQSLWAILSHGLHQKELEQLAKLRVLYKDDRLGMVRWDADADDRRGAFVPDHNSSELDNIFEETS